MIEQVWQDLPHIQASFLWPVERGTGIETVREQLSTPTVAFPEQVHGTRLHVVQPNDPIEIAGADGLVTTADRIALAAVGADCQVLLVVDPFTRIVGVAHAGWRGILAGIGQQLVETLVSKGADRSRLRLHIGPSVGPCHYVVDQPDTAPRFAQFQERFGPEAAFERDGERIVDLRVAQRQTLLASGIHETQLTIDERCTVCASEHFPSHRREGKSRHENLVGCIMIAL
ncbi:polyphenol oxidase family protein [Candidatus Berkelbacteria bacterium]|nr:polyphenol oxidase family protein [Candidatus Berkelbacteria bacterium]